MGGCYFPWFCIVAIRPFQGLGSYRGSLERLCMGRGRLGVGQTASVKHPSASDHPL
jgi:hypothetical protein